MRRATLGVSCVLSLIATTGAIGARTTATYFLTPTQMRNVIEERGFTIKAKHILVDTATCTGLRRYGVRGAAFKGFSCRAKAPDGSIYDLDTIAVTATHFDVTEIGIAYAANGKVALCMQYGGNAIQCIKLYA